MKTQATNNDYNGFEGMPIAGRPSVVTVRVAKCRFAMASLWKRRSPRPSPPDVSRPTLDPPSLAQQALPGTRAGEILAKKMQISIYKHTRVGIR